MRLLPQSEKNGDPFLGPQRGEDVAMSWQQRCMRKCIPMQRAWKASFAAVRQGAPPAKRIREHPRIEPTTTVGCVIERMRDQAEEMTASEKGAPARFGARPRRARLWGEVSRTLPIRGGCPGIAPGTASQPV